MKLSMDMGNSNLKFVGEVGGELKYVLIRSLATTDTLDTTYVVTHAGKKLCFGVGNSLVKADKTEREYIKESILLGVHQIYGSSENVVEIDLAIGLPLDLYKSSKKSDFEDKLKKLTNVIIDGYVNDEPVLIKVKSTKICAEGYSAFINLMPTINKSTPALIVDIGHGTTDVIGVSYNHSISKWQIDGNDTINEGMYNIYELVKKEFLDKEKFNLMTVEAVEQRFLNSPLVNTKTGTVDINKYIYAAQAEVQNIFNTIEKKFTDMQAREVYLVGGGAETINKLTENILSHKQLSNTATSIYANAIGYLLQIK